MMQRFVSIPIALPRSCLCPHAVTHHCGPQERFPTWRHVDFVTAIHATSLDRMKLNFHVDGPKTLKWKLQSFKSTLRYRTVYCSFDIFSWTSI
jgi:hypothetical protein